MVVQQPTGEADFALPASGASGFGRHDRSFRPLTHSPTELQESVLDGPTESVDLSLDMGRNESCGAYGQEPQTVSTACESATECSLRAPVTHTA